MTTTLLVTMKRDEWQVIDLIDHHSSKMTDPFYMFPSFNRVIETARLIIDKDPSISDLRLFIPSS
jgi:hypothetical protein